MLASILQKTLIVLVSHFGLLKTIFGHFAKFFAIMSVHQSSFLGEILDDLVFLTFSGYFELFWVLRIHSWEAGR